MAVYIYPAQSLSIPGVATEATLLLVEANTAATVVELQDVNTELNTQTTALNSIDTKVTGLNLEDTQVEVLVQVTDSKLKLDDISTQLNNLSVPINSLNVKVGASDFTLPYDTLVVTAKTVNGPTVIESREGGLGGTLVQTKTIVYDVDGDFQSSVVV